MTAWKPETVFITGASGDFGQAFARRFAGIGARLVITGRNRNKLEKLVGELDVPVHIAVFDVRDRAAVKAAIDDLPEDFRKVDLLINNAGLGLGMDPAHRCSLNDWETMVDTNIKGLLYCTRLLLPGMVDRDCGHVINIGSIAGTWPYPGGNVYCATKAFTRQFSLALRADLYGTKVRVTDIEPGMVETAFSEVRFKGDKDRAASVYADTDPLTAEDVAESVFWTATLPPHFNVNTMEIMPTVQTFGALPVHRPGREDA